MFSVQIEQRKKSLNLEKKVSWNCSIYSGLFLFKRTAFIWNGIFVQHLKMSLLSFVNNVCLLNLMHQGAQSRLEVLLILREVVCSSSCLGSTKSNIWRRPFQNLCARGMSVCSVCVHKHVSI